MKQEYDIANANVGLLQRDDIDEDGSDSDDLFGEKAEAKKREKRKQRRMKKKLRGEDNESDASDEDESEDEDDDSDESSTIIVCHTLANTLAYSFGLCAE